MAKQVYSLSICARATLDMHSLNNEGSEGTQIQTRMVDIVAADGSTHNVNAISGDMFKHIQAEQLYYIARNNDEILPLCAACRDFDANRISADVEYTEAIKGKSNAEAIDLMLKKCVLDDIEGNLLTGDRSTPRKSVVEFGWTVGVPEVTKTNSYFHVKYAQERGDEARAAASDEDTRKANLRQTPFHRPASSGIYAIVSHYEISRIGFNDISRQYPIDKDARQARYRALLESVLYTFIQPKGAMRSTQLPHIVTLEGAVAYSTKVIPAPTVSPLNPGYLDDIAHIAAVLNKLYPEAVEVARFSTLGEFAEIMQELIESSVPFTLAV